MHELCKNNPCKNNAICNVNVEKQEFTCDCPLGYQGATCEVESRVEVPSFTGNSYLAYTIESEEMVRYSTNIQLDLLTQETDAMIMWLGVDPTADDYLGLGVEDGFLKLVWNLGWFSRTELKIPEVTISDNRWHSITLNRLGQDLDIVLDNATYSSQVHGTYHYLDTKNIVMFGSSDSALSVMDLTQGHFQSGFQVKANLYQVL